MWKEQYGLGVELIDAQHKEIFDMTDSLVKTLEAETDWEPRQKVCKEMIMFLKNYVVMHFEDEENYQESINFSGKEAHKKIHMSFAAAVEQQEKRLVTSEFDRRSINQLVGMITAWLVNHVAGADQQIVSGEINKENIADLTILEIFARSATTTLSRMLNINQKVLSGRNLKRGETVGEVFVEASLAGDIKEKVVYGFSKEFSVSAMNCFTMSSIEEINDMVCSAILEITNIISDGTLKLLRDKGCCCEVTTSRTIIGAHNIDFEKLAEKMVIDTPMGAIVIGISSI